MCIYIYILQGSMCLKSVYVGLYVVRVLDVSVRCSSVVRARVKMKKGFWFTATAIVVSAGSQSRIHDPISWFPTFVLLPDTSAAVLGMNRKPTLPKRVDNLNSIRCPKLLQNALNHIKPIIPR